MIIGLKGGGKIPLKNYYLSFFISLFLLITSLASLPISYAQQTEVKVINPSTGNSNFTFYWSKTPIDAIANATVGTRFNATVWVYDVIDLFSFQVLLMVNDTLLNITHAWLPPITDASYVFYGKTSVRTPPAFYDDDNDNAFESVLVGDSILGVGSFTGSGLLAIIELEIITPPNGSKLEGKVSCNLNIDNEDTFLLDTSQSDIPATKVDGHYEFSYPPPTAQFDYFPLSPAVNETITFNATKSQPSNFTIIEYSWDFDDGTNATGKIVYHKYNASGYYNVTLTVKDEAGLKDTAYRGIAVGETITIMASPSEVMVGETVKIEGQLYPELPDANVTIECRLNKTGQDWQILTTTKTNSSGGYYYNWTTQSLGIFELKAIYNKTSQNGIIESRIVTVKVKSSSEITINIQPETVFAFEKVIIKGTIAPNPGNVTVTIEYRRFNSTQGWYFLANVTTNQGVYSYEWQATKKQIGTNNLNDTFEFRALWGGNGILLPSQSQPENLTVVKIELDISVTAEPETVTTGSNVTITGRITPPTSNIAIGIKSFTKPDASAWDSGVRIGTAYTNHTGHFRKIWRVPEGTVGERWIKVYYAGDNDIKKVNLTRVEAAFVNITKNPSSITISTDTETASIGMRVFIQGNLTPSLADETIKIYYSRNGGSASTTLNITVKTYGAGKYNFTWEAGKTIAGWKSGLYTLYAQWDGNNIYSKTRSQPIYIEVQKNSSGLTANLSSETIGLGENITVSGFLTPVKPNMTIYIYIRLNKTGESWMLLNTTKTDNNGFFNYTWMPETSGKFEIYAKWEGDEIYLPAESDIKIFEVVEPLNTQMIIIITLAIIVVVILTLIYFFTRKRKK